MKKQPKGSGKKPKHKKSPEGALIASKFRELREQLGLNQQELADKVDINRSYISQIETDAVDFGKEARRFWSEFFSVSPAFWYLGRDIGVPVMGRVMEQGIIADIGDEQVQYVPLPPNMSQEQAQAENVYALTISTAALYPYVRNGSTLYVERAHINTIKIDDLVIYRSGETMVLCEVEIFSDGNVLLRAVGRGQTIALRKDLVTEIEKVTFIGLP